MKKVIIQTYSIQRVISYIASFQQTTNKYHQTNQEHNL